MNRAQVLRRLAVEMMLPAGLLALGWEGVKVLRRQLKGEPEIKETKIFNIGNHGNFPPGTGQDARLLHHQLVALSRFSPEDREMLLDYMDAARRKTPQQKVFRDILNAWDDIDKGTFESGYQGLIDEAVVQSWSSTYRDLIDSMKRARWLAPSSVGADYVP